MKRSTERIITTHCGSLPRPAQLLDALPDAGSDAYAQLLSAAVADVIRLQAETGIDVLGDGELSKPGFFSYVTDRLSGFEPRPDLKPNLWPAELRDFPEYYEQYFAGAILGSAVAPPVPIVCVGPVTYRGQLALQTDIANIKAALHGVAFEDVFVPAVGPAGPGSMAPTRAEANEYYPTYEEYLFAVADAVHEEYQAIVDAGFIVQVDDPFLAELFTDPALTRDEVEERAELHVGAINRALRNIPADRVRYHTCYGINEGPRVHDAPLADLIETIFKINASAISFEGANARHEHEYHVFENVKLPDDRVLIPGVITHSSNIVEHPELIAERLVRYARLVGRERVIAGADCGFSSQATYKPEVHPTVMWAKFAALREGAELATDQLWRAR